MAKSYKVGDTTYQFPDDFEDAKVQGILTEQGVIKAAPKVDQKAEPESATSRFFSSAGRALNPIPMVKEWWENRGNQAKSVNALGKIMELRQKGLKDDDPEMKAALDEAMGIKLPTSGNPAVTQVPFMSEPAIAAGRQAAGGDLAGAAGTVVGAYGVPAAVAGTIPYVKPAVKSAAGAVSDVVTSPPVIKGLKRSTEGVVVGSAMHGNIPGVALGAAARTAVGGLESWAARRGTGVTATAPASAAVPALWDEIAMSQAGRKFSNLSPEQQAGVQRIAEGMQPKGTATPPVEATPAPTPGRFSSEDFRSPPPPVEVSASLPESPQASAPTGPMVPAPPPRVGGVKQVAIDAKALTDKLVEWKMSPDEAAGMNRQAWERLAFESGVPAPSAAVQRNAIFGLKKTLAGPPKTALELLDQLRKGGRASTVPQ